MHMDSAACPKDRPIVMPAPTIRAGTQHTKPDQMKAMLSQLLRSCGFTWLNPADSKVLFAMLFPPLSSLARPPPCDLHKCYGFILD